MSKKWERWSNEEDEYLKKNKNLNIKELSNHLNRTTRNIQDRRKKLGITKAGIRWTKLEDEYVLSNYLEMTNKEISIKLGRTTTSIVLRMRKLGITRMKRWTASDDEYLLTNYDDLTFEELAKSLNRSRKSIIARLTHKHKIYKGRENLLDINIIKQRMLILNSDVEITSNTYSNDGIVKCKCKIDNHEWTASWKNLSQGSGCPKCGIRKTNEKNRKDFDELKKECKDMHPHLKILSEEYINNFKNLKVLCTIHNVIFNRAWNCLKQGRGNCPKCSGYKGEIAIFDYFTSKNIKIKQQYIFKDCVGLKGGLLRFDFGVLNRNNELLFLIEYDGEGHEKPIKFGGISEDKAIEVYNRTRNHDEIKNKYCLDNKYELLRIGYKDYKNIDKILYEFIDKCKLLEEEI